MSDRPKIIDVVPAELVLKLDSIFCNVPGVDVVELGALLLELTGGEPTKDGTMASAFTIK